MLVLKDCHSSWTCTFTSTSLGQERQRPYKNIRICLVIHGKVYHTYLLMLLATMPRFEHQWSQVGKWEPVPKHGTPCKGELAPLVQPFPYAQQLSTSPPSSDPRIGFFLKLSPLYGHLSSLHLRCLPISVPTVIPKAHTSAHITNKTPTIVKKDPLICKIEF